MRTSLPMLKYNLVIFNNLATYLKTNQELQIVMFQGNRKNHTHNHNLLESDLRLEPTVIIIQAVMVNQNMNQGLILSPN